MFNDIYYPAFSSSAFHYDNCRNNPQCAQPSRTIDKEMYERLLKSFDEEDAAEDERQEP